MAKSKSIQTAERYLRELKNLGADVSKYRHIITTKSGKKQNRWDVKESDVENIKKLAQFGREFKKNRKLGYNVSFPDIKFDFSGSVISNQLYEDLNNQIIEEYEANTEIIDTFEYDDSPIEIDMVDIMLNIIDNLTFEYSVGRNNKTSYTEDLFDAVVTDIKYDLRNQVEKFYNKDREFANRYWDENFIQIQDEIAKIDLSGYYSPDAERFKESFTGTGRIIDIITGNY